MNAPTVSTQTATSTESLSDEVPAIKERSWDELPLSPELRETLRDMGYTAPTPVQLAVFEPASRLRDVIVQARTGTGKTSSFGLPIVDVLVKRSVPEVQVIVLCPTRELALQVSAELEKLAARKAIKILPIYGGAPMERQVNALRDGTQVVVGTPGRVLDHIRRGTLKTELIKTVVLDEADEMLSMGFERELSAILEALPPSRHTLLFSATLPPDIERMAKKRLKDPELLTLSGDHIGALEIDHFVYMLSSDKIGSLVRILEVENPESAVVFCNTKDETENVASALNQRGFQADWLNGDLPQNDREKVMSATREGRLRFLVATDVAARGIDISHLTHVINYDFPQDAEAYVHRTGRTGRAGRTGTAISLIMPQDIGGLYLLRLTYKIKPLERQIPSAGELKTRQETDLIGLLATGYSHKGQHAEDRALARRLLTHDDSEAIVAGLIREVLGARENPNEEARELRQTHVRRAILHKKDGDGDRRRRSQGDGPRRDRPAPPPRREGPPREPSLPREPSPPRDAEMASANGDAEVRGRREARAPREDFARDTEPPRAIPRAPSPPLFGEVDDKTERTQHPKTLAAATAPVPSPAKVTARSNDLPQEDGEPRREGPARRSLRRGRTSADAPAQAEESAPAAQPQGVPAKSFATWQPPAEAGDDEPLLPKRPLRDKEPGREKDPDRRDRNSDRRLGSEARPSRSDSEEGEAWSAGEADAYAELFVSVGRKHGVRAEDIMRALVEVCGLDKHSIRRVRVRDRHSFVAVRKVDTDVAIAKLTGTELAGKPVAVEVARERSPA